MNRNGADRRVASAAGMALAGALWGGGGALRAASYSFDEPFNAPPLTPGTETGSNSAFFEDGFKDGDNGWVLIEQPSPGPGQGVGGGTNYGQRPVSFWPHGGDTQVSQVRQRPGTANAYAIRNLPSPLSTGNVTIVTAGYSVIGDIDFSLRLANADGTVNAMKLDFGCPQLGTDVNDFLRAKQDDGGSGVVVADANTLTTDGQPLKWNITAFTTTSGDYAILSVDWDTAAHQSVVTITTVDAAGVHRSIAPVTLSLDPSIAAIERISLEARESPAAPVNGSLAYLGNFSISGQTAITGPAQWNVNADGNWSVASNWSGGVPNGVGAAASFGTIITSARTVMVDAPQTVGSISFASPVAYTIAGSSAITLDVNSGAAAIDVQAGSHVISAPMVLNKDVTISTNTGTGLDVSGTLTATGRSLTKSGAGTVQFANVRATGLSINGGTVRISAKEQANSSSGTSVVQSLAIASGAALDLNNNSMVIDYTGPVGTLASDIRGLLQSGQLASSSADATKNLGYADNAALGLSSFAGQSVDSSSLLVKYTYLGDTNLDGMVDVIDLGNLATAWQTSGVWANGDSNYDGQIDVIDLGLLATNWQAGVGSPLGPQSLGQALAAYGLPSVSVPEPGGIAVLALFGGLMRARRRRS